MFFNFFFNHTNVSLRIVFRVKKQQRKGYEEIIVEVLVMVAFRRRFLSRQ